MSEKEKTRNNGGENYVGISQLRKTLYGSIWLVRTSTGEVLVAKRTVMSEYNARRFWSNGLFKSRDDPILDTCIHQWIHSTQSVPLTENLSSSLKASDLSSSSSPTALSSETKSTDATEAEILRSIINLPNGGGNLYKPSPLEHKHITAAVIKHYGSNTYHYDDGIMEQWCIREKAESDLFDVVEKGGPMKQEMVLSMFLPIVQCLAAMHRIGLYHLDLKLENILVVSNQLKLTDFGLSIANADLVSPFAQTKKSNDDLKKEACGSQCRVCEEVLTRPDAYDYNVGPHQVFTMPSRGHHGTTGYSSPETTRRQEFSPPAADVFSLGICIFICLVAQRPFGDTDLYDRTYHNWMNRRYPKSFDIVKPEMMKLIRAMTHPNLELRPSMNNITRIMQKML